jgi:hypothetical protein
VKLTAGGIKGPLLLLWADAVDQRAAIIVNYIEENLFDIFLSQRRGFVRIPDDLSAERPKIIDVLLDGLRRQIHTRHQVFEERPEEGHEFLARTAPSWEHDTSRSPSASTRNKEK